MAISVGNPSLTSYSFLTTELTATNADANGG
jgi:hypothetical protein